jgi:hypothetical protein
MFESDLESFQRQFADALAGSGEDGARVLDTALARALEVHRNTAAKAARDALAANYPILRALCGDEAFFGWAADFIRGAVVCEPRLNLFGEGFDAFLRGYEPARRLPYASDVAAVERLVTEALFAADAEPAGAAQLVGGRRAPRAIVLHPATRFTHLATPAVSIWLAHHDPRPGAFEAIEWSAEGVLVTRPAGEVEVRLAARGAVEFLRAWIGDGPRAAARAADEAGAELTPLMSWLIEAGAFA